MKNIIIVIAIVVLPQLISAQVNTERTVINSTGGTYNGENINIDFSVGETVAGDAECPTLILNQGFIQADETTVGVEIKENTFSIEAYPNPSMDKIKLLVSASKDKVISNLQIKLTDINGKIIKDMQEYNISDFITKEIDITDLPSGSYYISITNNEINKLIKIVKVK
jgi:hypothetical protein